MKKDPARSESDLLEVKFSEIIAALTLVVVGVVMENKARLSLDLGWAVKLPG